jgi:NTE family protein
MGRKVALVLSGGGAKGAFQFGAIKYIEENLKKRCPNLEYDIIAGVSVGTLNGGMMAMGKYQTLKDMWGTISDDGVYTKYSYFRIAWRILFGGAKSFYSNEPLRKKVQNLYHLNDVKYDFRFGIVSLKSGLYWGLRPIQFNSDVDFQNAVLASTVMPIVWEPIPRITLKSGEQIVGVVDGGLRNVSPLGDVLGDDPSHIIIINCSPKNVSPSSSAADNVLEISKRSLTDITINEIFNSDIEEFLRINDLVQQAERKQVTLMKGNGKPYKAFNAIIIQPDGDIGDSLDFSQESIQRRIDKGYNAADKAFQGFVCP